jgi:hypothetical protein
MVTDMTTLSKVGSSAVADAVQSLLRPGPHLGGGARDFCLWRSERVKTGAAIGMPVLPIKAQETPHYHWNRVAAGFQSL